MKLSILADVDWQSKIDSTVLELADFKFRQYFEGRGYGDSVTDFSVVFMCRDPSYEFKRRIRHSKKEKRFHMDIMLDLPTMMLASPEARRREVVQRLFDEVPEVLSQHKLPGFDKDGFVSDFHAWLGSVGWR